MIPVQVKTIHGPAWQFNATKLLDMVIKNGNQKVLRRKRTLHPDLVCILVDMDSENDHALLQACEYAVAVANAVRMLKSAVDRVTRGDDGEGAAELRAELIADDFAAVSASATRRPIVLGALESGATVSISPMGANLLIAGSSGSGKSTLASGFLERLAQGLRVVRQCHRVRQCAARSGR